METKVVDENDRLDGVGDRDEDFGYSDRKRAPLFDAVRTILRPIP